MYNIILIEMEFSIAQEDTVSERATIDDQK